MQHKRQYLKEISGKQADNVARSVVIRKAQTNIIHTIYPRHSQNEHSYATNRKPQ